MNAESSKNAKRWRRVVVSLVVFAFIGVVVNVGVAWTAATRVKQLGTKVPHGARDDAIVERASPENWYRPDAGSRYSTPFRTLIFGFAVDRSYYTTRAANAPDISTPNGWIFIYQYGWPARSLGLHRCREDLVDTAFAKTLLAGGLRYTDGLQFMEDLRGQGRLPLLPIWPGFAINTAFYGSLAWGVWLVPGVIRRVRRTRRGLCKTCGYELGGLARCPECGASALRA